MPRKFLNFNFNINNDHIRTMSKLEIARLLKDKKVTLLFNEEDDQNNLLGFLFEGTIYVFEKDIK